MSYPPPQDAPPPPQGLPEVVPGPPEDPPTTGSWAGASGRRPTSGAARLGVGLGLLVPAALALLYSYVGPTVSTVWGSVHRGDPLGRRGDEWVGFDNYEVLGEAGVGRALLLALVPVGVVVVLAPVLAWAADHAGTAGRRVALIALALPMVAIAPTAIAFGWVLTRRDSFGEGPGAGTSALFVVVWLSTFGLVCGIAVTCYLAALRRRSWPALVAVGGLLVLATFASVLQVFAYSLIVGPLGPGRQSLTPTTAAIQHGFVAFDFGAARAVGTVQLLILGVLGIGVWLIVARTRMRIELDRRRTPAGPAVPARSTSPAEPGSSPVGAAPTGRADGTAAGGWAISAVLLVVVLAIALYGLWPWLKPTLTFATGELPDDLGIGKAVANGWLPPLVSTVVAVGLALLGGFAIGGLRPLGERSEWLLLPFAPWLFVGVGPLLISLYERARDLGQVDTWAGLVSPGWLSVPALFLFTLLFRGLGESWRRQGTGFVRRVLLPALPMVVLAGGIVWVVRAQDLLWPYMISQDRDLLTPNTLLNLQRGVFIRADDGFSLGLVTPLPLLIVLVLGLIVLQVTYLERLALSTGRRGD